jgi:hypothetical protein
MLAFLGVIAAATPAAAADPCVAAPDVVCIPAGDVDALYDAVNDELNAGKTVKLAPGTYVLTTVDPRTGEVRPHGGMLWLQRDMNLAGSNVVQYQDGVPVDGSPAEESVIDARSPAFTPVAVVPVAVPDCSGRSFANDAPIAVLVGKRNRLSRLTVRVPADRIGVGTFWDPIGGGLEATVSDCAFEGGLRGMVFPNHGAATAGFGSNLVFERNLVRDSGVGLTGNNFVGGGCAATRMRVTVRDNRFMRQTSIGASFIAGATGSDDSLMVVTSERNVFEGAARGVQLVGAQQQQIADPSNRNRLCFLSSGDRISAATNAGVGLLGANNNTIRGTVVEGQDNRIAAWFAGTAFSGNSEAGTGLDLTATAGNGLTAGPGAGNRIDLTLCAASGAARVRHEVCAGAPCAVSTNVVEVLARAAVSFVTSAGGFIPDAPVEAALALACPADVVVEAAGPAGATVALSAPTVTPEPVCSAELGLVSVDCAAGPRPFPLGETRVDCAAAHVCGTTAGCSYRVTVADTTPPEIAVAAPAAGATLLLGSTVAADYGCADAATGVRFCAGTVPAGAPVDTSTVGAKTLLVTASDGAGNVATFEQHYSVRYQPAGTTCLDAPGHAILRPIAADGTSVFHREGVVPARFRVCDAAGRSVGQPGVVAHFSRDGVPLPCASFRWDEVDQSWVSHLAVRDLQADRTYAYVVGLDDGSEIAFQLTMK